MRPLRCFSTVGFVAAVLTGISQRLRMDPSAWAEFDVVADFVEYARRKAAN